MDEQSRIAFFHEDDYCQWEILPLTSREFCVRQMGKIDDFGKERQTGSGFTDMFVREDSLHGIEELALRSEQLNAALQFLPPYARVETGYSSSRRELKATYGRGEGAEQNVFWSVNDAGLINALWLDLCITRETKELWQNILTALGKLAPLLLADWGWSCCVDLTSADEINRYVEGSANA